MPRHRYTLKLCARCGKRTRYPLKRHTPRNRRYYTCNDCFVATEFEKAQKLIKFCYDTPIPEIGLPGFLKKLLKGLKADE